MDLIVKIHKDNKFWTVFDINTMKPIVPFSKNVSLILTQGWITIEDVNNIPEHVKNGQYYIGLFLHNELYMAIFETLDDISVLKWPINRAITFKFDPFDITNVNFNIHSYLEYKNLRQTDVLGPGYTTGDYDNARRFLQTGEFQHLFFIDKSPNELLKRFGATEQKNGLFYLTHETKRKKKRCEIELYTNISIHNIDSLMKPPLQKTFEVTVINKFTHLKDLKNFMIFNMTEKTIPGTISFSDLHCPYTDPTPICLLFAKRQEMLLFTRMTHVLFPDRSLIEIFCSTLNREIAVACLN